MTPGRIDFLATNKNAARFRDDASYLYRCENLALALNELGHTTRLAHIADDDDRGSPPPVAAIFHRPRYGPRLWRRLARLRAAGATVVIDLDDLIIDPAHAAHSPAVVNGLAHRYRIWTRFWRHRKALAGADLITVSTEPLAEHIRALHPDRPVLVIPNAIHLRWRRMATDPAPPPRDKTLLYAPGTRSHDRDFEAVREPIERFLATHPEVRLQLIGPLVHRLSARDGQVSHLPRLPFADYGKRIRGGWVNLCPLEPSPFNRCKSAIKVIEAGYWNIPTVCSPNPDCERFGDAGALIAATADNWFQTLESLVDPAVYQRRTDGLRERTLALAEAKDHACRFLVAIGVSP